MCRSGQTGSTHSITNLKREYQEIMDEKAANRKKSELLMVSKDFLFADVLGVVTIILQSVIPDFIISHLLQNLRRLRFHYWGRTG
jgi:hypothetical protein